MKPVAQPPGSSRFASDVLVRFVTQVILRLRSLIFLPLIVKTMGAAQYGAWAQISVTLALVAPVMDLRLGTACVRYLSSKKTKDVAADFFPMLFVVWIVALVTYGIGFIFREQIAEFLFNDQTQVLYVELLLVLLGVRSTFTFLRSYYRTFNQIAKYSAIELVASFGSISLASYFLLSGEGLAGVLIAFILVDTLMLVLVLLDIIRQIGLPSRVKMGNLAHYLRYSLPLIPNTLLFWVINSSDRYVIAHLLGLEQVAVYSASYSLSQLAMFFVAPISFVLFPAISKLWAEGDFSRVRTYMESALKYVLLLSVPSTLGLYYVAPFVLGKLASQAFVTSQLLILYVTVGFFCLGVYQIMLFIIHLRGKTKILPLVFLIAAGLNLALNFLLIPRLGIMGAAVATLVAYLVQTAIVVTYVLRLFQISFDLAFLVKAVIAASLMLLLIKRVPVNSIPALVAVAGIGAGAYFVAMIIMKGIGRREHELLRALFKRGGR